MRKYLLALAVVVGCLVASSPQIASAAPVTVAQPIVPLTSGWQCVTTQCGQVVGAGLHVSYLHYGLFNSPQRWCGFIEAVEQTNNHAWSDVQYTGTMCSTYAGVYGNLGINVTMPAGGELYEYAIPMAGFPSRGVNVFYIN